MTSGGTALYRSYLFGWNTTQPCSLEDKKTILAHEMVHNWPQLNDNPYGVTTWYSEGTAEYYSVLLPLRLGLMTDDELFWSFKSAQMHIIQIRQEHLEMRRLPPFAGKTAGRSDWFMAEE